MLNAFSSSELPSRVLKWIDDADKAVFLFDFDGTMVHLAAHPDEVIVPEALIGNLRIIARNDNLSFAIVTGRALHKLDALTGLKTVALGSHGAEWRKAPGAEIEILANPLPPEIRRAMNDVAIRHSCIYEDKIYTISMHMPFERNNEDITEQLICSMGNKADHYIIRRIDRTYEVLQKNINKGSGIRHLMQQSAFADKWPVYIGDDVGTDDSLSVVDDLGGMRLGVNNNHHSQISGDKSFITIDSVSYIVQLLAHPPKT